MKRTKIPNSVRFEVFKRDRFCCQFCGRRAPDVILQIDHLRPHSKGGNNDILNLITSCAECNSGKSNKPLSKTILVDKTRDQLAELEERRQQLEMMVKWKESLSAAKDILTNSIRKHIEDLSGYELLDEDVVKIRRLIQEFGYDEVSDAVPIAADQYFEWRDGKVVPASLDTAISKLGGICKRRAQKRSNPHEDQLYFALNIWKKNAREQHSLNIARAMDAIRQASGRGVSISRIKSICGSATWITRLENELESEPATEISHGN